jgi:hypothetical protein
MLESKLFYFRNQMPMLRSVLTVISNDQNTPNFKSWTLHFLLKEISFVYDRKWGKVITTVRWGIVPRSPKYLVRN